MKVPENIMIKFSDYPNIHAVLGERIDRLNAERAIPFKSTNEYILHLIAKDCRL